MTLPGIPAIWQGDEFGLTGVDGEDSRTPLPWHELDAASDRIGLYRRLAGLRSEHPALANGGLRWLHVSEDLIAFAREAVDEVLVVVAARCATSADLGLGVAGLVLTEGTVTVADGVVTTGGAAFAVWSLGPADAPGWSP
jgi:alpha-glucosidase